MDKKSADARAVQCNPNNPKGGPGHQAGYHGTGARADLDNHGNQLNPNNPRYQGKNMDQKSADARAVQCNPNNPKGGPGHQAGYHGTGTKADLDNHRNQLNPNNPRYQGK